MYVPHPLNFPARAIAKLRQRAQGFTMIELMMALLVVAILAAIAVPTYKSYIEKSRLKAAMADVVGLSLAMEQAYQKKLIYPNFPSMTPTDSITGFRQIVDDPNSLTDALQKAALLNYWRPTQVQYFTYWIYTDTPPTYYYVGVFSRGSTAGNPLPTTCMIQMHSSGTRVASAECGLPGNTW